MEIRISHANHWRPQPMEIGAFMADASHTYGLVLDDRWLEVLLASRQLDGALAPDRLIDFVAAGDDAIALGQPTSAHRFGGF